jgi:hypothetical protein
MAVPCESVAAQPRLDNSLVLAVPDGCQRDIGDTLTVAVWMRNLTQQVTGFQAFLEYDNELLGYRGDLSSYTSDPFDDHVQSIFFAELDHPGQLDLEGHTWSGGTSDDSLLATLVFDITAECETTSVPFRDASPFTSGLSNQGNPIPTELVDTPLFILDDTPPTATQGSIDPYYATDTEAEAAAIAATTDPTDNCSAREDILITADTSGDCSATITVTLTDECGNETEYYYNTRIDNEAPTATQGSIASCYASAGLAEAAAVAATTDLDDNCTDPGDLNVTVNTVGDCSATVTVTIEDECENAVDVIYDTRIDDENPSITAPGAISMNADAGGCDVTLTPSEIGYPVASDNCSVVEDIEITFVRSDGKVNLSDAYEAVDSPITITWQGEDECGNIKQDIQTITVSALNEMVVSIAHQPTITPGPLDRCITFELWDCALGYIPAEEVLTFSSGIASTTVLVACGDYECVTARDMLHTLRRTLDTAPYFEISGRQYVADFYSAGADLLGGNFNDDSWIEILDYAVFVWQWGTDYGTGDTDCTTAYPHADIDGDGWVDNVEFTFLLGNFLAGNEDNCCGEPLAHVPNEGPLTEVSVRELYRRGLGHLAIADSNGDGWVDEEDMIAFAQGVRPAGGSDEVSERRLKGASSARGPR